MCFFKRTRTTAIYTLSLHDALPICRPSVACGRCARPRPAGRGKSRSRAESPGRLPQSLESGFCHVDRKSTRLNSSHPSNSYAVFCLKKKIVHSLVHRLGGKEATPCL